MCGSSDGVATLHQEQQALHAALQHVFLRSNDDSHGTSVLQHQLQHICCVFSALHTHVYVVLDARMARWHRLPCVWRWLSEFRP